MSEYYEDILDSTGRVIGRHLVSDGSGLPPQYNRYAWHHFLEDALTDAEGDALFTLKQTSVRLQKFLSAAESRREIDFNEARAQQFLTYLVNQNVLTAQRALALRG